MYAVYVRDVARDHLKKRINLYLPRVGEKEKT